MRQIIILGSMCLISHNLLFETTVQKKTGSSAVKIITLRLAASFVVAFILNLILPESGFSQPSFQATQAIYNTIWDFLYDWAKLSLWLSIKVFLIIFGLIILQNVLKEFGIIKWLSRTIAPVMRLIGLSDKCSFLWVVGQTLGLTYGSGILMEEVKNGIINEKEARDLNDHLALNHSQIEDTMLFVAIGAPYLWMALPRFFAAIIFLWGKKIFAKKK